MLHQLLITGDAVDPAAITTGIIYKASSPYTTPASVMVAADKHVFPRTSS
jgi:hypothetical protein